MLSNTENDYFLLQNQTPKFHLPQKNSFSPTFILHSKFDLHRSKCSLKPSYVFNLKKLGPTDWPLCSATERLPSKPFMTTYSPLLLFPSAPITQLHRTLTRNFSSLTQLHRSQKFAIHSLPPSSSLIPNPESSCRPPFVILSLETEPRKLHCVLCSSIRSVVVDNMRNQMAQLTALTNGAFTLIITLTPQLLVEFRSPSLLPLHLRGVWLRGKFPRAVINFSLIFFEILGKK